MHKIFDNFYVCIVSAMIFLGGAGVCLAGSPANGASNAGAASWYGEAYRGKRTASGERFNPADFTAAHPNLPMGTLLEVSRPDNHRRVVVRVNDRGPGGGRILDVSEAAARRLGLVRDGTAWVSVQVIGFSD